MATTQKFVGDFRNSVTQLLNAFDGVQGQVAQCKAMGWTQESFDAACQGTDISSADFYTAITACDALVGSDPELAGILAKLRQ